MFNKEKKKEKCIQHHLEHYPLTHSNWVKIELTIKYYQNKGMHYRTLSNQFKKYKLFKKGILDNENYDYILVCKKFNCFSNDVIHLTILEDLK